jgi:eukaryotic-like serine/threonine-protein kinase
MFLRIKLPARSPVRLVGLKAVNCQTGDTLAQEELMATSKEKVIGALGDAAAKLRGQMGESLVTVQKFGVERQQTPYRCQS